MGCSACYHARFRNFRKESESKSKKSRSKRKWKWIKTDLQLKRPFVDGDSKRQKKCDDDANDEDRIETSDSEEFDDRYLMAAVEDGGEEETPAEKRKRLGDACVEKLDLLRKHDDDSDDDDESDERGGKEVEDKVAVVARMLNAQLLEESGRVRKFIASRVQNPETTEGFRLLVKHKQSTTVVVLSEDDTKVYSASKDGSISQCDIENGKKETYGVKDSHRKCSKDVLALAISSDGRYLASGGFDQNIHIWDTRTRELIQDFPGHKGPISCLTFRQGTSELFSGSYDRTIKIWNAEDRSYITTLFGHQSDVLTINCLRKERVLTAGRDRTMRLWKVPEESQLVFRSSASSSECCCFINNDEFLSGSDDGSIEHWSVMRKKPLHIIKNAHGVKQINDSSTDPKESCSWVSSVAVCRGSDLAASGAGNGVVRLWKIENDAKGVESLLDLPLVGYINSLAFAKSGKFLVAGVGKEPRLGRWGSIPAARNGVAIHPLQHS